MTFVTRWQRYALAALVMLLCLAVPACKSKVTSENMLKIKPGMTEKEVKDILGSPDKSAEEEVKGFGKLKMDEWKNGDCTVKIGFRDDKVAKIEMNGALPK